jgi:lactobin A/cerein 7B family class IIb bacteriocin
MKNLDLNTMGVSELNADEMKTVDGGFASLAFLAIAAGIIALIYLFGGGGDTTVEASN